MQIICRIFFTGSSSSSQLLERLIFRKHYSQLTTLLFQTNLTPHLVTEGVLVPLDVGDISSAATAAKKAELVLLKIAGSLDAHFPNSFHKLIKVMKTYGNDDLKQLAIIMENESFAAKDASIGKLIYGGYRRLYVILAFVCRGIGRYLTNGKAEDQKKVESVTALLESLTALLEHLDLFSDM